MRLSSLYIYTLLLATYFLASCSAKIAPNYPINYYKQNEKKLVQIENLYNHINKQNFLSADFTDKNFQYVSLELKTDTLRYVYEFNLAEKNIYDTLYKFGFDTAATMTLIRNLQQIKCTWINKMDYYVDNKKQFLTYMSIRPINLDNPFAKQKYCILTFYKQPQYYDAEGRLLDKKNRRRLRKISNETFWRINDKVAYTISSKFR